MLFKRGTKDSVVTEVQEKADVVDEEKGGVPESRDLTDKARNESGTSVEVAVPMMSDVFTWKHLQYDVRVGKGETRRLLEDVSGYVAPGKLTALMGESGAGKVSKIKIRRFKLLLIFSPSDDAIECSRGASGGWRCRRREAG